MGLGFGFRFGLGLGFGFCFGLGLGLGGRPFRRRIDPLLGAGNDLFGFFITNAANFYQVFNGRIGQLFGGVHSFFKKSIRHRGTHTADLDEGFISLFHGVVILGFTVDIQVPAGQFGCQAYVLTPFANGHGEEFVGYDHLHGLILFVDDDPGYLRRGQRIADKFCCIHMPGNNVDFFTPQLLHHVLHPAALHSDTCPNRIDIRVLGSHGNFCPNARLSGGAFDIHNAFGNFRHFGFEKNHQKVWMRPGEDDLGASGFVKHVENQGADSIAAPVVFSGDLFAHRNNTFGGS